MPSSGYASITFTAGEQPTTAKWNLIGSNDASFNTGTGFNDNILITRHFATSGLQLADKTVNPYKFSAYRNAALTVTTGSYQKIPLDAVEFDTGSNVSLATGLFTAPIAGFYQFAWAVDNAQTASDSPSTLFKNGAVYKWGSEQQLGGSSGSSLVQLALNDTIGLYTIAGSSGIIGVGTAPIKTYLTGFLVSAT